MIDQDGNIYQNARFDEEGRLVSLEENEWDNIEPVDRLRLVDFSRTRYLRKKGTSLWLDTDESGPARIIPAGQRPKVLQGFLEKANVNPVTEMVEMISVNRAYEANQKMIQTQDSLTGRLLNEAIRV